MRAEETKTFFGSTVGKGYYHHTGGPISMSGGGRRHNGPHNGHYNMAAMTIEYNGHHPPREPRKEENTLVRRSFRRSGDEWRADSRRCVWKKKKIGDPCVRFSNKNNKTFFLRSNILSFFSLFLSLSLSFSLSFNFSFLYRLFISSFRSRPGIAGILAIPVCKKKKKFPRIQEFFNFYDSPHPWSRYIFLFLFFFF